MESSFFLDVSTSTTQNFLIKRKPVPISIHTALEVLHSPPDLFKPLPPRPGSSFGFCDESFASSAIVTVSVISASAMAPSEAPPPKGSLIIFSILHTTLLASTPSVPSTAQLSSQALHDASQLNCTGIIIPEPPGSSIDSGAHASQVDLADTVNTPPFPPRISSLAYSRPPSSIAPLRPTSFILGTPTSEDFAEKKSYPATPALARKLQGMDAYQLNKYIAHHERKLSKARSPMSRVRETAKLSAARELEHERAFAPYGTTYPTPPPTPALLSRNKSHGSSPLHGKENQEVQKSKKMVRFRAKVEGMDAWQLGVYRQKLERRIWRRGRERELEWKWGVVKRLEVERGLVRERRSEWMG